MAPRTSSYFVWHPRARVVLDSHSQELRGLYYLNRPGIPRTTPRAIARLALGPAAHARLSVSHVRLHRRAPVLTRQAAKVKLCERVATCSGPKPLLDTCRLEAAFDGTRSATRCITDCPRWARAACVACAAARAADDVRCRSARGSGRGVFINLADGEGRAGRAVPGAGLIRAPVLPEYRVECNRRRLRVGIGGCPADRQKSGPRLGPVEIAVPRGRRLVEVAAPRSPGPTLRFLRTSTSRSAVATRLPAVRRGAARIRWNMRCALYLCSGVPEAWRSGCHWRRLFLYAFSAPRANSEATPSLGVRGGLLLALARSAWAFDRHVRAFPTSSVSSARLSQASAAFACSRSFASHSARRSAATGYLASPPAAKQASNSPFLAARNWPRPSSFELGYVVTSL